MEIHSILSDSYVRERARINTTILPTLNSNTKLTKKNATTIKTLHWNKQHVYVHVRIYTHICIYIIRKSWAQLYKCILIIMKRVCTCMCVCASLSECTCVCTYHWQSFHINTNIILMLVRMCMCLVIIKCAWICVCVWGYHWQLSPETLFMEHGMDRCVCVCERERERETYRHAYVCAWLGETDSSSTS